MKTPFRIIALTALLLALPLNAARAGDITAEQSALMYDLLDPATKAVPDGVDKDVFNRAVGTLKDAKLMGAGRPNFNETGILETYGKALMLGTRAKDFMPEIGHIRDLVARGDTPMLKEKISDLWLKLDRPKPDDKALQPVIDALYGAKGEEPEETVNHTIRQGDSRIDIKHSRAGGVMEVAVTKLDSKGEETERTVFQGETETVPEGNTLQRRLKPARTCTSTPETDKAALDTLDGDWTARGKGQKWKVSHDGSSVTLEEPRDKGPPLLYTGTLKLGHITAAHTITAMTDIDDDLPAAVRSQLISAGISFRVSLETCASDTDTLSGTWSSQHVTYNGISFQVKRIHDPYDLSLVLTRGGEEKSAEGAPKDAPL